MATATQPVPTSHDEEFDDLVDALFAMTENQLAAMTPGERSEAEDKLDVIAAKVRGRA